MEWYIFAILAALLTSAAALTQKKVLLKQHAMEFSATLALLAAIITLPMLFAVDLASISGLAYLAIYGISILGAIAFLMVAKAVRHMSVGETTPILVLGPGVTALMAFLLLGESLSLIQIGGIALLIIGAYVLELKRHHSLFEPFQIFFKSKYIHYILLALLIYSLTAVGDRTILSDLNIEPIAYIVIIHFFLAINYLIMISIFHDGLKGIKNGLRNNGWWLLLVAALTVSYRFAQANAVKAAYVGMVVAIKRTSALFTTIIGGELFHETNLFRKSMACLIMIAGAVLLVI